MADEYLLGKIEYLDEAGLVQALVTIRNTGMTLSGDPNFVPVSYGGQRKENQETADFVWTPGDAEDAPKWVLDLIKRIGAEPVCDVENKIVGYAEPNPAKFPKPGEMVLRKPWEKIEPLEPADKWAIVEIMGHQRTAGRISTDKEFGTSMLQLEVPYGDGFVRQFLSPTGAVFRITECSEEMARSVADGNLHPNFEFDVEKFEKDKNIRMAKKALNDEFEPIDPWE